MSNACDFWKEVHYAAVFITSPTFVSISKIYEKQKKRGVWEEIWELAVSAQLEIVFTVQQREGGLACPLLSPFKSWNGSMKSCQKLTRLTNSEQGIFRMVSFKIFLKKAKVWPEKLFWRFFLHGIIQLNQNFNLICGSLKKERNISCYSNKMLKAIIWGVSLFVFLEPLWGPPWPQISNMPILV